MAAVNQNFDRPVMDETIVMIHGMWGGPWCWDHYKAFFENKGYRCIAPALRYHAGNPNDKPDPRVGAVSLLDYADDMEMLIRGLDAPVILMGHSMGGLLAQILASRSLAEAAVLLTPASPGGILTLTPSVIRSFWSTMKTWGFWKKPVRQTFKEASYSTLGVLPAEAKVENFNRFVHESGRVVFEIGLWYLDPQNASRVDESKITCPVCIITGTKDKMTPVTVVRKIARKYKDISVYKEFANHGHWVIGEPGWEEIAAYTSDWLDKVLRVKRYEAIAKVEKRKYKRTQHRAIIAFASLGSDVHYHGELNNYSQGGLHFTSSVEIEPGSEIQIQWIDHLPDEMDVEGQQARNAEVIWRKQRKDDFSYDIGVQFSENPSQHQPLD